MTLPEIRIKYAWLLAEKTATPMLDYYDKGSNLRSFEEYEVIAAQYQEWWRPYEHKVLTALCDATGLRYKPNVIDVYVAPFFYAFSDPLVLGVKFDSQQKLVCNLTHELTHRLLMDNTTHDDNKTIDEWTHAFGERDFVELVHIPVHALMHYVFIDVLDEPALLECEVLGTEPYKNSWEYVQTHDYDKIIKQLQQIYKMDGKVQK